MQKPISIIVVMAENRAIGINNKLLCHLPNDLKRFKKITNGHKIIMGKNTFESLPGGTLPNRENIVLSDNQNDKIQGCAMAYSIEQAIELFDDKKENFIVGGGSIYKQFLPLANKLYLTFINHKFDADTYFPEIDFSEWEEVYREDHQSDERHKYAYSFVNYERI